MNPKRTSRRTGAEAQVNLRRRRTWHQSNDPSPKLPDPLLDAIPPPSPTDNPSVLADLQAERNKRKSLEKRVADMETAREEEQVAAAEAAGQWKELYENERKKGDTLRNQIAELGVKSARAESLETVINRSNEQMLTRIPEDKRALIPMELDPEVLYERLPQWISEFAPPAPVNIGEGGGTPNGGGEKPADLTPEQELGFQAGNWESREAYLVEFERLNAGGAAFGGIADSA